MPFYEYQCSSCSHHIEVLQKITDSPLRKCPDCGKQTLKKLISAPVFRLKGSGWYETDFKSENEQKRNLADRDEGGDGKSEASKADGADSKSEAKSESKSAPSKVTSGGAKKAAKPAAKPAKSASKGAAKRAKPAKSAKTTARKKAGRR